MKLLRAIVGFIALLSFNCAQAQLPSLGVGAGSAGGGAAVSVIKSIQPSSITMAAAAGSGTATISAITVANAIIVWNGSTTTGASTSTYARNMARLAITNTTTITATRESTSTDAMTIYFTIVEFASGVNSITAGVIAITTGNTTNTASITAVGANSFVLYVGASTSTGAVGYSGSLVGLQLTNSTTVTATLTATYAATVNVGYMVADLDATIVQSVQPRAISGATTATSITDAITSIVPGQTILFPNGDVTSGSQANSSSSTGWTYTLTNATTVTLTRSGTANVAQTLYYTVVQFASAALNSSVQRGTIALASATSNTAAISSVSTTKAFVVYAKFWGAAANANTILPYVILTDATTVTAAVNSAGTTNAAYEIIEFR